MSLSRLENETTRNAMLSGFAYLSALPLSWPRVNPEVWLGTINDKRVRLICDGLISYIRGDFAGTINCYMQNEGDEAAQLYSSTFTIGAAISEGNYSVYKEIESFLKGIVEADVSAEITAYAELCLASAYLGAMAPNMAPNWIKDGDFSALPIQIKPEASNRRSKYFQCIGEYKSMLSVAETALAFFDSPKEMSITGTYLKLMCAVASYNLNRMEDAKRWLLDAMNAFLPYGFITPFAELLTVLGGLVEQLLEKEYPAHYDAIIRQWQRSIPNWIAFHNYFTRENIPFILSPRETEIVELAAQGVPYRKIAEQFHISIGRLKNIMHEIYGKLYVKNRKELLKLSLTAPQK